VVDDDVLGRSQYLTLYLVGEPVDETLRRFRELAVELRDLGRFHEERTSHLFGGWELVDAATAPAVPLAAAVVPWRPATGVFALVEDAEDADAPPAPIAPLLAVEGVVGAWAFAPSPVITHRSWLTRPYRITVLWLDDDPPEVARQLAPLLAGTAPVFAGPYRTIRPGEWGWFD
jgi:hypothetical protein